MDTADIIAIQQVIGLYGHLVDQRQFSELDRVYTDDAVFDTTDFGIASTPGLAAIVESFETARKPLAVYITNIVVTEDPDGTVRARSKSLGVLRDGHVAAGTYEDVLVQTDRGWRVRHRTAKMLREEDMPLPPPRVAKPAVRGDR